MSGETRRIDLRLPREAADRLAAVARSEHRSVVGLVRHLVLTGLGAQPEHDTPVVQVHTSEARP